MLHEQYRPTKWEEFRGNTRAIQSVRAALRRFTKGAFWITGPSGTGKTTLAWLIAKELGANDFDCEELDGDRCNVDAVRALGDRLALAPMAGDWTAIIVNEAHAMSPKSVQAWLTLLERLPPRRVIIFTTTTTKSTFKDFDAPLKSRCLPVSLSEDVTEDFANRARRIAVIEGLDGKPIEDYRNLVVTTRETFAPCSVQLKWVQWPPPRRVNHHGRHKAHHQAQTIGRNHHHGPIGRTVSPRPRGV